MFRTKMAVALALASAFLVGQSLSQNQAMAQNVWLSLNLEFNDPTDYGSGGTWTVVAKADLEGLAGVVFYLDQATLNFNAATGFLTPAGMEEDNSNANGLRIEIVQADLGFISPTYDIGVPGGTYPSSYVDDPALSPLWGNPDLGSFTGGVELVTGSFDPGDIPDWYAPEAPDGNVYFSTSSISVLPAPVQLTVRAAPIPEPATFMLGAIGLLAVATRRRTR